jgi:hypothetical protein
MGLFLDMCNFHVIEYDDVMVRLFLQTLTGQAYEWYTSVGPWLWKEAENEEEKVKSELCGRHSDCHWVEMSKRTENMERSVEKKVVG